MAEFAPQTVALPSRWYGNAIPRGTTRSPLAPQGLLSNKQSGRGLRHCRAEGIKTASAAEAAAEVE